MTVAVRDQGFHDVKTSVETLDDVKIKLTVEVEAERVKRAFDRAARELAKEVNLPGFRPGKAPRKVIEQRFGQGAIAQAALEESISEYYVEALRQEQVEPVAQPDVDVERFDEAAGCAFTATVEIRPTFDPPDHTGIRVEHPDWEVTDAEVDEQLEVLRDRFAELDEVERTAQDGDYVTLSLDVELDGEPLEDVSVTDAMYEIGSGGVTPKLDETLIGAAAGDELSYDDQLPDGFGDHSGKEATFRIRVADVRAKNLPDLDDDFAMTASGFDTLDELRDDVRKSVQRLRIQQARHELRGRVLDAYLARVEIPLPQTMIDGEVDERMHRLEHQADEYGVSVEDLLGSQDSSRDEFTEQARGQATNAVKARIVLDRLAETLDVGVSSGDIEMEILRHAQASGMKPEDVANAIQSQGSLPVLVGDVMRRKAIDVIVEAAEVDGAPSQELLAELELIPSEVPDEDAEQPSRLIVPGQEPDVAEGGDISGGAGRDASGLIVPGR